MQELLDQILRTTRFRSVQDLQYIPGENVVYVQRKMGFKSCLIDVSGDETEEDVREHLMRVPAIY
jgi:hypothetical protein